MNAIIIGALQPCESCVLQLWLHLNCSGNAVPSTVVFVQYRCSFIISFMSLWFLYKHHCHGSRYNSSKEYCALDFKQRSMTCGEKRCAGSTCNIMYRNQNYDSQCYNYGQRTEITWKTLSGHVMQNMNEQVDGNLSNTYQSSSSH